LRARDYSTPVDFVDRLERWFQANSKVQFEAVTRHTFAGGFFQSEEELTSEKHTCLRLNDHWKISAEVTGRTVVEGRIIPISGVKEYIVTDGQITYVQDKNGKVAVTASFTHDEPDIIPVYYYLKHTALPFGFIECNGEQLLPDVLRDSSLALQNPATSSNEPVLEGDGKQGRFDIAIDPQTGAPMRIELEKEGKDLWFGFPLEGAPPNEEEGGLFPTQALVKVHIIYDNFVYDGEGRELPRLKAFTQTDDWYFDEGGHVRQRRFVTYKEFQRNPAVRRNSFAVSTPIPNGTPVGVSGASGINYKWQDGEVVEVFDETAVRRQAEVEFWRGFQSPGYVAIVAAMAVLIIVLLVARAYVSSKMS